MTLRPRRWSCGHLRGRRVDAVDVEDLGGHRHVEQAVELPLPREPRGRLPPGGHRRPSQPGGAATGPGDLAATRRTPRPGGAGGAGGPGDPSRRPAGPGTRAGHRSTVCHRWCTKLCQRCAHGVVERVLRRPAGGVGDGADVGLLPGQPGRARGRAVGLDDATVEAGKAGEPGDDLAARDRLTTTDVQHPRRGGGDRARGRDRARHVAHVDEVAERVERAERHRVLAPLDGERQGAGRAPGKGGPGRAGADGVEHPQHRGVDGRGPRGQRTRSVARQLGAAVVAERSGRHLLVEQAPPPAAIRTLRPNRGAPDVRRDTQSAASNLSTTPVFAERSSAALPDVAPTQLTTTSARERRSSRTMSSTPASWRSSSSQSASMGRRRPSKA